MAKTNLTTFFENSLLAPFFQPAIQKKEIDQKFEAMLMARYNCVFTDAYSLKNKVSSAHTQANFNNVMKYQYLQTKKNGIVKLDNKKRIKYITENFSSLFGITEDTTYLKQFDNILLQLGLGPPRKYNGKDVGWTKEFEAELPTNFYIAKKFTEKGQGECDVFFYNREHKTLYLNSFNHTSTDEKKNEYDIEYWKIE